MFVADEGIRGTSARPCGKALLHRIMGASKPGWAPKYRLQEWLMSSKLVTGRAIVRCRHLLQRRASAKRLQPPFQKIEFGA